jgi:hypothetical protein
VRCAAGRFLSQSERRFKTNSLKLCNLRTFHEIHIAYLPDETAPVRFWDKRYLAVYNMYTIILSHPLIKPAAELNDTFWFGVLLYYLEISIQLGRRKWRDSDLRLKLQHQSWIILLDILMFPLMVSLHIPVKKI